MERNIFNHCNDLKSLKDSYKDLAKRYHPDNGGTDTDFQFFQLLYLKRKKKLMQGIQYRPMRNGKELAYGTN